MKWNYTINKKPITYKTGHWDGKNSDYVLAQDKGGNSFIAYFNDGFLDGSHFEDWYDNNQYEISKEIVRWMEIPD